MGPARHDVRDAAARRGIKEIIRAGRVVICGLIPLVLAGQKIVGIFVAVTIGSSRRPSLLAAPQSHAPTSAAEGQIIGRRLRRVRVEEIDEGRRLVPTDVGRWLIARPCPRRDIRHPARRRLGDGVLGDLVNARAVFVRHRAIGGRISRIARVADVNEVDIELVTACAEGIGLRGGLDGEGDRGEERCHNGSVG